MKRNARSKSIRKSSAKYTPVDLKLARYTHDPRRLYDGRRDEDAFLNAVGTIKAVRLG